MCLHHSTKSRSSSSKKIAKVHSHSVFSITIHSKRLLPIVMSPVDPEWTEVKSIPNFTPITHQTHLSTYLLVHIRVHTRIYCSTYEIDTLSFCLVEIVIENHTMYKKKILMTAGIKYIWENYVLLNSRRSNEKFVITSSSARFSFPLLM